MWVLNKRTVAVRNPELGETRRVIRRAGSGVLSLFFALSCQSLSHSLLHALSPARRYKEPLQFQRLFFDRFGILENDVSGDRA